MTEKEIGCDNCYYSYFDEKAYPCSLCIRGIERTDKWQPNRKTKEGSHDKALECIATMIKARNKAQTDLLVTEYPQNGEVILIGREKIEAVLMSYSEYKSLTKDETEAD